MKHIDITSQTRQGQLKTQKHKVNTCSLPAADGVPAINLPLKTKKSMVVMGCDAAERYLGEGLEGLPSFFAEIRKMTPPQYWSDVEAGFMGRLEQRLRSDLPNSKDMKVALAVGNSAAKELHEAATAIVNLAKAGALIPMNQEGIDQLNETSALVSSITVIGPASPDASL